MAKSVSFTGLSTGLVIGESPSMQTCYQLWPNVCSLTTSSISILSKIELVWFVPPNTYTAELRYILECSILAFLRLGSCTHSHLSSLYKCTSDVDYVIWFRSCPPVKTMLWVLIEMTENYESWRRRDLSFDVLTILRLPRAFAISGYLVTFMGKLSSLKVRRSWPS